MMFGVPRMDAAIGDPGECWLWPHSKTAGGYGDFQLNGRKHYVHRYAYEIASGTKPSGEVMHSCDNPACFNPDHLSVGTHADNAADMVRKGRSAKGESHSQTKFSNEMIDRVQELRALGLKYDQIVAVTGVSRSHACRIVKRKIRCTS